MHACVLRPSSVCHDTCVCVCVFGCVCLKEREYICIRACLCICMLERDSIGYSIQLLSLWEKRFREIHEHERASQMTNASPTRNSPTNKNKQNAPDRALWFNLCLRLQSYLCQLKQRARTWGACKCMCECVRLSKDQIPTRIFSMHS